MCFYPLFGCRNANGKLSPVRFNTPGGARGGAQRSGQRGCSCGVQNARTRHAAPATRLPPKQSE